MEASEGLKERALSYFKDNLDRLNSAKDSYMENAKYKKGDDILFPICFEGVIDSIYFNPSENRFTKIELTIAKTGTSTEPSFSGGVYCDEVEYLSIPIPQTVFDNEAKDDNQ